VVAREEEGNYEGTSKKHHQTKYYFSSKEEVEKNENAAMK
jgi:hypothetical protein